MLRGERVAIAATLDWIWHLLHMVAATTTARRASREDTLKRAHPRTLLLPPGYCRWPSLPVALRWLWWLQWGG